MIKTMEIPAKEKLIHAARQMIEDNGYSSLNINNLADKAGVAIGTLYWHFKKGKISIIKELAKYEAQKMTIFLNEVKIDSDNPAKGFKPFILKYIEYHRKNKALIRAFEIETINNSETASEFEKITQEEIERITNFIENIFEKEGIKGKDLSDKIKVSTLFLEDLVHKHVISDNKYGSDELLADVLINIFNSILNINQA